MADALVTNGDSKRPRQVFWSCNSRSIFWWQSPSAQRNWNFRRLSGTWPMGRPSGSETGL